MQKVLCKYIKFMQTVLVTESQIRPIYPCPEHLKIGEIYYDQAPDFCDQCIIPENCIYEDAPYPGCIYQMRGLIGSRYCLKFGSEETVKVIDFIETEL